MIVRATCIHSLPKIASPCHIGDKVYASPGGSDDPVFFDLAPDIYEVHSMTFAFGRARARHVDSSTSCRRSTRTSRTAFSTTERCSSRRSNHGSSSESDGPRLGARRVSQARSEKPPSTTSVCPRIISASGEQRKRHGGRDVVRCHELARRRSRRRPREHLLAVRERVERVGLDDACRHGVDANPARRELDGEIADDRLEGRLRGADEDVVVEHALRPEARERDDGAAAGHAGTATRRAR